MTKYNLYAQGSLLNSRPLSTEEVVNVMNQEYVYKKHTRTDRLDKIPVKNIKVVKTIVV